MTNRQKTVKVSLDGAGNPRRVGFLTAGVFVEDGDEQTSSGLTLGFGTVINADLRGISSVLNQIDNPEEKIVEIEMDNQSVIDAMLGKHSFPRAPQYSPDLQQARSVATKFVDIRFVHKGNSEKKIKKSHELAKRMMITVDYRRVHERNGKNQIDG